MRGRVGSVPRIGVGWLIVLGLLGTVGAGTMEAQPMRANGCRGAASASPRLRLYLEAAAVAARDTVAQVRVCLALPAGVKVGSFHLEIDYDSTKGLARADKAAPSGTQVANTLVPGRVAIAGASPAGFSRGTLHTLTFRRRGTTLDTLGALGLTLRELNALDGTSLAARTRVEGIGHRAASAPSTTVTADAPVLAQLEPLTVTIVPGGVTEVMIRGRGFTASGNVVMFGPAVLGELRSPDGTTLRLLIPNSWPSSGEAPPRQIDAGRYAIQIRNTRGLSNSLLLTLVNP